jgi:hypothetical protein
VNGLGTPAVFDEIELNFQFALVFAFGVFNRKLHGLFLLGVGFLGVRAFSMRFPALGALLGFTNDNVIAIGTRDRAPDEQNVFSLADLDNFEILGGRRPGPCGPGIFMPRMTVLGKRRCPMAPERRRQPLPWVESPRRNDAVSRAPKPRPW